MADQDIKDDLKSIRFDDFAFSTLSLYSSPKVRIRIGSSDKEYQLPLGLLCKQSSYFEKMFKGPFKEGLTQEATLHEIPGVVTARSFQMLVQWIHIGEVNLSSPEPEDIITFAIEFARLADMCNLAGVDLQMANQIKHAILANPYVVASPNGQAQGQNPNAAITAANPYGEPIPFVTAQGGVLPRYHGRDARTHSHLISSEHLESAANLPNGHPIRAILAEAFVELFFKEKSCELDQLVSKIPSFAVDLLKAVRSGVGKIEGGRRRPDWDPTDREARFHDSLSGQWHILRRY